MKWRLLDSNLTSLKVEAENGIVYFIPWDQNPVFVALDLLAVTPSEDPETPLPTGQALTVGHDALVSSVIRDGDLLQLWRSEREKREKLGELKRLPLAPTPLLPRRPRK